MDIVFTFTIPIYLLFMTKYMHIKEAAVSLPLFAPMYELSAHGSARESQHPERLEVSFVRADEMQLEAGSVSAE